MADWLFDALLTLDKNLPYQQNLDSVRIAVLIIHAYSNRLADLLPLLPETLTSSNRPFSTTHPCEAANTAHASL